MKKVLTGALLTIFSVAALAETGFSADLLLGRAEQESSISGFGSTSGTDTSFGIRGAYTLNPNIAFELGYHDYGQTNDRYIDQFGDAITDKVSTTAINAGVKVLSDLDSKLSVHGRLGLSLWDAEIEETDSFFAGQVFKASDDGADIYYGVGAQYLIAPRLRLGAEYTLTDMEPSLYGISVDHEVSNFALSLSYRY